MPSSTPSSSVAKPGSAAQPGFGRSLRAAARRALSHRALGIPVSNAARLVGAERLAGKIAKMCRYVPPRVQVAVAPQVAPGKSFWMTSDHGRDQVTQSIWWKGQAGYESTMPGLFAACAVGSRMIFDVGANTGVYTLIAGVSEPVATIHAFEPFPPCQSLLEANLKLNHLADRVTICRDAVGEQSGQFNLYVPLQDHGAVESSCSLNARFRSQHSQVLPVNVITLDQYVAAQGIGQLDLMKIDVETQEASVIRGAANVLETLRPIVFLEVLGCADVRSLDTLAKRHGYVPVVLAHEQLLVRTSVTCDGINPNQVLCPPEKLEQLKSAARRLGYPVTSPAPSSLAAAV